MRAQPGLRPDAVSYTSAITACQRGGESSLALSLFDEMLQVCLKQCTSSDVAEASL